MIFAAPRKQRETKESEQRMNFARARIMGTRGLTAMVPFLLAACASAPPAPPPPPPEPLAYGVGVPGSATYVVADTTHFDAQMAQTDIAVRASVALDFAADTAGALRVTGNVTDLDGRFTNSATGGTMSADESGVRGEFRMVVTREGEIRDFSRPDMTPVVQQVTRSGDLLRSLFLRVPGRAVPRGFAWTDTIAAEESSEGTTTRTRSVVTSTWTGDTIVGGRTLRVIESTSQNTIDLTGSVQGTSIRQHLEGATTARSLWDAARGLLVWRRSAGTLTGSMELPQVGSLPVRVQLTNTVELTE